jgi:hypothetical protein
MALVVEALAQVLELLVQRFQRVVETVESSRTGMGHGSLLLLGVNAAHDNTLRHDVKEHLFRAIFDGCRA